ncbi:MAG: IBR domain-containing protein [Candidatus Thorarchaeota archaeon]
MSVRDDISQNNSKYTYCPECGSLLYRNEQSDHVLCSDCFRKMRPRY